MKREEMTLEKAEKIIDNMYQSRWEECGVCEGNTIHMGNLDNLQYNELERASILLLRVEMRLSNENANLKQTLLDIREYMLNHSELGQAEDLDYYVIRQDILQIIDKILGGSDE